MNFRVNRCVLFVPINNPRFVEKAWTRGADAIILDLEDSIPMAEKPKARGLVRETIAEVAKGGASVFVRIGFQIHGNIRLAGMNQGTEPAGNGFEILVENIYIIIRYFFIDIVNLVYNAVCFCLAYTSLLIGERRLVGTAGGQFL